MRTAIIAVILWALAAINARATPTVDAGTDRVAVVGLPLSLNGTVNGLSPIDFWVADGNTLPDVANRVRKYSSVTGHVAVGPMQTSAGVIHGFPGDFININGTIYGVDQGRRDLYTIDPATAVVTPIGSPWSYPNMGSLAYDAAQDLLYGIDYNSHFLFKINRTTAVTTPFILLPLNDVHSMEYVNGFFYVIDNATQALYRFVGNPNNIQLTQMCALPCNTAAGELYDELAYYRGAFYASFHSGLGTSQFGRVRRIDIATGQTTDIGPLIPNTNVHAMLINSMPEDVLWSKHSGPGGVTFSDAANPQSNATFSIPGEYVLKLTVLADPAPVFDTMSVTVYPNVDCNTNGSADALDVIGGAADCNTNGTPDDCESSLLEAPELVDLLLGNVSTPWLLCFYDLNHDGRVDGDDVPLFVRRKLGS